MYFLAWGLDNLPLIFAGTMVPLPDPSRHISPHAERFVSRWGAHRSPLFRFSMSRGPPLFVLCLAVKFFLHCVRSFRASRFAPYITNTLLIAEGKRVALVAR